MKRNATALLVSGALMFGAATAQAALPDEATLYKNPQCGCCDEYARHLVPYGMGSCHTIEIGNYWIEGHVPMEAVEALFDQQPEVDGIGLAGMPIGTPGMPGPQSEPYNVYLFSDQDAQPFMTL